MPEPDRWTIGRLLTWTTDYLRTRGAETPRLDAEVLLAEACRCRRIELYTAFDELVDDGVRAAYRQFVRRRAAGEPVAYIVGHREFFSLSFRVTPDVLIPRPETEHLVVELLDRIRACEPADRPVRIADVGTGSGAIAVAAAKHAPACRITATDISPAALEVARSNALRHEVADRIDWLLCDLLSGVAAEPQFDFVVSNPPYVGQSELAQLPATVRAFEPHTALVAGPTGTEVIERLIPQAAERLRTAGWLLMEVSPMVEASVRAKLAEDGRFDAAETAKDLAGLVRVVKARRAGHAPDCNGPAQPV